MSASASAVPRTLQDTSLWEFVVNPTVGRQRRKVGGPDCFFRQEQCCSDCHSLFLNSESQVSILHAFLCGWRKDYSHHLEREHTLVTVTETSKFSQITPAEAASVNITGHSSLKSGNSHTFAYSSNIFWNLPMSLSHIWVQDLFYWWNVPHSSSFYLSEEMCS